MHESGRQTLPRAWDLVNIIRSTEIGRVFDLVEKDAAVYYVRGGRRGRGMAA